MRRTGIWLSALAMTVVAGSASAINVDGQWNDWFSYGGTSSSNWNQNSASNSLLNSGIRYANDAEDDASGGQDYDIEQIFYYYEDYDENALTGGVLYIGMVTGYEASNSTYRAGDMFIDLGCNDSYDLAVATGTESSTRFGDTWENDGWQTSHVEIYQHRGADPYRVKEYRSGATFYGNSLVDWDYGVGVGSRHNFLEMAVVLTGAHELEIATSGIGLHWTMACGNDFIDVCDSDPLSTIPPPPTDPNTPVPEPATMALLGMGLMGLALRSRRQAC